MRGPAPALKIFPRLAEFHDRRTRRVAVLGRIAFLERVRPMEHPDIAVRVGGGATHAAQQHPIRHRWESCIDFEDGQDRL